MSDTNRSREAFRRSPEREHSETKEALSPTETQKHYEYRFNPPMTSYAEATRLADIISKFVRSGEGGVAAERKVTQGGDSQSDFFLKIPKHLVARDVEKMFQALNATGLVKVNISGERYAPNPEDERFVVRLKAGENLVSTVQVGSDGRLVRAGWRVVDGSGNERQFFSAPSSFGLASKGDRIEIIDSINLMDGLGNVMGSVFKIERN